MADQAPYLQADYDRTSMRPRLLHIGFGAFAKAHVMVFHDEMLRQRASDWGVVAARLNSGMEELSALDWAGGLYTVGEMSNDRLSLRQVGAVIKTLHPRRDGSNALPDLIAHPDLAVITLTITEKGYCLTDGHLDTGHAGIEQDLKNPASPSTAIGVLAEGLRQRQAAGQKGLTILSCDNLPANGHLCRRAVLEFAELIDPSLTSWIDEECRFPCSMVDRITPAMTEGSYLKLRAALGRPDPKGILCEPFRQWVIEDDFAGARPDWHLAGVEFVSDVAPFEDMKLRLLNGTHSFLAYLGALAGLETVSDCMADPVFMAAARGLMLDEQAPTLSLPEGVDVTRYCQTLLERFSNRALHHKTTQIASDGSQKLPQRLLAPIRLNLEAGRPWPLAALGVAGWIHYCRGVAETGASLPLSDPLAERITAIARASEGADYVTEMLSLKSVFGSDLPASDTFCEGLQDAYRRIASNGVRETLSALIRPAGPAGKPD